MPGSSQGCECALHKRLSLNPGPPRWASGASPPGPSTRARWAPAPGVCWKHTNEHPDPAPPADPALHVGPPRCRGQDSPTPSPRRARPGAPRPGDSERRLSLRRPWYPTCWPPPPDQQENSHFRREGQGRRPRAEVHGRPVAVRRRPSCHLSPKGQRTAKQTKRRHAGHQPGLQVVSRRRGGRVEALSARPPAGAPRGPRSPLPSPSPAPAARSRR